MDHTECLEKLEDFFCANCVLTSNYGVVMRCLLSDPVRCELYKHEKSFVELIKCIHPLRQRESQIIKQCAEVVAKLGRRACVSDRDLVALLAGGVASREVHRAIRLRDPPTFPEAHKGAEERRAMATINPLTGSVVAVTDKIWSLNILLLDDSDAMVSVSILYVQFYGAFIIQCPRPNLRQQRQQKMNKSDISKNPVHSLLSRKQPITTVNY
ncbi:hypothetical protein T05_13926 [Trichinella murrelli]|uniref:Uncharacterized protein n=1 Tax=Trichinella murrelli TaxID=144512 RepID=A0A0V0T380_9BILA|nr:hypothetical protein T05_13926 [Trichinella murrelli]